MSKHTPAPWIACVWKCHAATTVKAADVAVAECESEVDARLIAAAPDLLEACKRAAAFIPEHAPAAVNVGALMGGLNVMNALKAAIIKAEGTS